jgi:uroporphyrinogen decarboxylase
VEAALALDVADRPPVSAWGHNYDLEWDAAALARETVERTARLGLDFVKLQLRATTLAEVVGSE